MPKAIIEFNLPEENGEYAISNSAMHYYTLINDLFNEIRSLIKYERSNFVDSERDSEYMNFAELSVESKESYYKAAEDIRVYLLNQIEELHCYME